MDNNSSDVFASDLFSKDLGKQKIEWRKKAWSIPDLRGSKHEWFSLTIELIGLVANGQAVELDGKPSLLCVSDPQTWRTYMGFLKGMGLVKNQAGILCLSETGLSFCTNPTPTSFADLIQNKVKLFGEVLAIIQHSPSTVEDVDGLLCRSYNLDWSNLSNTRRRMDWLEILGYIQEIGNRKWAITEIGSESLRHWILVSPEAIRSGHKIESSEISTPPEEISSLLQRLVDNPDNHKKRCTYNIWAPSPNRIDNLKTIIQYASVRVARSDFFHFIEEQFTLRASSVESMLPFLKAAGLLEEVGRNTYQATPAGQAWIASGDDLNFIRILHAHMRFVGEMIAAAEKDIVRNDLYAIAKNYGLNTEKTRWIAGFLIEAGLLEEPQYLHLHATQTGLLFISALPLQDEPSEDSLSASSVTTEQLPKDYRTVSVDLFEKLHAAACDPMAESKASGVAFEERIAEVFRYMGFQVTRIGGPGNTDVVVRWKDAEGKNCIAIIDGKSKSSGAVSHTDISDVAIDAHKEKNEADYVAIVGPGFSGDTIRNHAQKKAFALITDSELSDIARSSHTLGLSLQEIALLFKVPHGLSQLEELISCKRRELDVISAAISKICEEQALIGSLSPRDLFLLLRATNLSPSLEELLSAFKTLSQPEIGLLSVDATSRIPEHTSYALRDGQKAVSRLRSLADAIEAGLSGNA